MKYVRPLIPVLLLALVSCSPREESIEKQAIVLEGATVIDGTGAAPRAGVVVVQGGRIVRVGKTGGEPYPNGALVVDLSGRYILPGFIDTHAHPPPESKTRPEVIPAVMRILLAFGITTIRNPGARPGAGVALRDRISAGELLGPRVLTAGPLIDAPSSSRPRDQDWAYVESEAEIRAEVRRQRGSGGDFIKLYCGLKPELVSAAIDESHKAGLPVIGHVCATSWLQAAQAGIDTLVHSSIAMIPPLPRDGTRKLADGEYVDWMWRDGQYYRLWRETFDLDGAESQALISALVDNHVEVNPTLVLSEASFWGDDVN